VIQVHILNIKCGIRTEKAKGKAQSVKTVAWTALKDRNRRKVTLVEYTFAD
jgi:hypothetical protein